MYFSNYFLKACALCKDLQNVYEMRFKRKKNNEQLISWPLLGRFWPLLGRSWPLLGCSWSALGLLLAALGRSWGGRGASLGRSWPALRRSRAILGPPESILHRFSGSFGADLGRFVFILYKCFGIVFTSRGLMRRNVPQVSRTVFPMQKFFERRH